MAAQNYAVDVYQFGEWSRGTVIPEYVALWAFGESTATDTEGRQKQIHELVERSIIKPTRAEVAAPTLARIKEIAGVKAKVKAATAVPVPDHAMAEIDSLRGQIRAQADQIEAEAARANAAEGREKALSAELVDYVEKNAHLSAACEDHQTARDSLEKQLKEVTTKNAELTAELEAATTPDAPKG